MTRVHSVHEDPSAACPLRGGRGWRLIGAAAGFVLLAGTGAAQQAPPTAAAATPGGSPSAVTEVDDLHREVKVQGERLEAMRSQIAMQMEQLEAMKRTLAAQEAEYQSLRHAVGMDVLDRQRAGNIRAGGSFATAQPMPSPNDVAVAPTRPNASMARLSPTLSACLLICPPALAWAW